MFGAPWGLQNQPRPKPAKPKRGHPKLLPPLLLNLRTLSLRMRSPLHVRFFPLWSCESDLCLDRTVESLLQSKPIKDNHGELLGFPHFCRGILRGSPLEKARSPVQYLGSVSLRSLRMHLSFGCGIRGPKQGILSGVMCGFEPWLAI